MNESRTCVICQHETEHMACIKCQRRMSAHLGEIVTYAALAANELIPGRGGDGRGTERGLGVRLEALDFVAGFDVLPVLESWERMFRDEWGYAPWGPTTAARGRGQRDQASAYLTGTVTFLTQHMDKIADHPAVDDFAAEVGHCWHRARSAARQQPRQAWRIACPADRQDGECGNPLRITGEDVDHNIHCRACGSVWTLRRLLLVAIASGVPIWLDIESAAEYFSLHPGTLRKWARAGHIHKKGNQFDFQSIYSYVELGKQMQNDKIEMRSI
jgi:hypothetical protein